MNKAKSKKLRDHRSKAKKSPARHAASSPPQAAKEKSAAPGRAAGSKPLAAPKPVPPVPRTLTPVEVAHQHSMERFEHALQLFNQNQISKARGIFERLSEDPARELAERARVYVRICEHRLNRATLQLKTAEDYYNYAVGLSNKGNAEESEDYLLKALKLSPKSDYIYYALATTYALRDNVDGALEHLGKAIELNERNRYQAQNDSDFANLLEDPRFTELLYPEKPIT
jgi:tetratricopeptide (TPR) repeat protein